MRIAVPKEIKTEEHRVGLTPASVRLLVADGHEVSVETGAGIGIGMDDSAYRAAGARIVPDAPSLFAETELIIKVKEPQPGELSLLRPGHTLFTYLHLAPDPVQAKGLLASGATAIAYETVTDAHGGLPLLAPMSEIAGRMAIQVGAHFLERPAGGRGVLLSGVPGVTPGSVLILGGGTVGRNAARIAVALGAEVTVMQRSLESMREIDNLWVGRVQTAYSEPEAIARALETADIVICAALVPGGRAPRLISRGDLDRMKAGSVIVDVAIDQGGCCETSRPTTHATPTYVEGGVIHYCVSNMPGAVPRTSAQALNHATLPYVRMLAAKGVERACVEDAGLRAGLTVKGGMVVHPAVAAALGFHQ